MCIQHLIQLLVQRWNDFETTFWHLRQRLHNRQMLNPMLERMRKQIKLKSKLNFKSQQNIHNLYNYVPLVSVVSCSLLANVKMHCF